MGNNRERKFISKCKNPNATTPEEWERLDENHECSKDQFHNRFKSDLQVLICSHHKECKENLEVVEKFKKNVIAKVQNLDEFSRKICVSCYSQNVGTIRSCENCFCGASNIINSKTEADTLDNAIFILQTIEIEGHKFNLFFDSGCGDMVTKKSALD